MPSAAVYCTNAFLLSVVMMLGMSKLAPRLGLVDVPTGRKLHEGQIPLVGAGVFLAILGTAALLPFSGDLVALFVSMGFIVALGVVDDVVDLRSSVKFVAQCTIVAILVLVDSLFIRSAGNLLSEHPLLLLDWGFPVAMFATVGLINSINMIDGVDGLAGGVALTALIWFALAAEMLGLTTELLLILVFAFGVLGFLVFNLRLPWRPRAAVFLGDGGSMMLGLLLAYVAIRLTQRNGPSLPPIAALWICALPVTDTLSLIVRRVAAGDNVGMADHRHLHDLLLRAGLSVSQTVFLLVGISAGLGAIGIAGWLLHLPDRTLLMGLVLPVGVHCWFIGHGWKQLRPRVRPAGEAFSVRGAAAAPASEAGK
jgi:UDP-GlcNAc:undecaprenyl-phosphate GlcNAc-1-phosphate transferase